MATLYLQANQDMATQKLCKTLSMHKNTPVEITQQACEGTAWPGHPLVGEKDKIRGLL